MKPIMEMSIRELMDSGISGIAFPREKGKTCVQLFGKISKIKG